MGKGLQIESQGTHVAFAAGTGVLVFVDLVAHLIISLLAKYEGHDLLEHAINKVDIDNFKLILYTSFSDEQEAICLPLIEGLKALCAKHQLEDLFEHVSRISSLN